MDLPAHNLDQKPSSSATAVEERRRSTRLSVSVPVTLSGRSATGESFREETHTLVIGRHGAAIATAQILNPSQEVEIENTFLGLSARARVISWRQKNGATPAQIGVELLEKKNIWGVKYPPADWWEPVQPGVSRLSSLAATQPAVEQPETAPETSVPPAAYSPAPSTLQVSANISSDETLGDAAVPASAIAAARGRLEAESENVLKAFNSKLAKLIQSAAAQVGAHLQTQMKQAADDLEARRKAAEILDGRLSAALLQVSEAARNGSDLAARLKEIHAEAEQKEVEWTSMAGQRRQDALRNAEEDIRQALEQAAREVAERTMQLMETAGAEHIERIQQAALLQDEAAKRSAQSAVEEVGQTVPLALEAGRQQMEQLLAAAAGHLKAEASAAHQSLAAASRALAEETRNRLESEVAARLAGESAALREAVKAEASEFLRAEDQRFSEQIAAVQADLAAARRDAESGWAQLRDQAFEELNRRRAEGQQKAAMAAHASLAQHVESLRDELKAELLAVLHSERAATLEQVRQQIDSTLQASLARAEALVKVKTDQLATLAAAAADEALAKIRAEGETLKTESGLALRRLNGTALEEAKQCLNQESDSVLENLKQSFNAHCQAQEETWNANLLASLQQKRLDLEGRLVAAFKQESAAALEEAKVAFSSALAGQSEGLKLSASETARELRALIQDEAWAEIDIAQKRLEDSLRQTLENWTEKAASRWSEDRERLLKDLKQGAEAEAFRLRTELADSLKHSLAGEQVAAVLRGRAAIEAEISKSLEGFSASFASETERLRAAASQALGHSFESALGSVRQHVEQLMQEPLGQLACIVEDTVVLAREEVGKLQQERLKSVEEAMAGVTRQAFDSISSNARALGESYRSQMSETLRELATRSAESLKQFYAEEHERQREIAFSHLQKDAEDFSAVAVGQFKSQSEKAMHESLSLVNQQVGAAALVVKEWLDQTTARLDAHLARLEAKSNESLVAIEQGAQRSAQLMLGNIQQESQALVGEMQNRMLLAARILEGLPASVEGKTPAPEPADRTASVSVRRVLARS